MNFFLLFTFYAAFASLERENYEKQLQFLKIKYLKLMKILHEKNDEDFGKIASYFWEIKKTLF